MNSQVESGVRTTVTIPAEHYSELLNLARQNKVSVAWLVRDAVEKYLSERAPLLSLIER